MAKSKAKTKANKKKKENDESDREDLALDEYFVGVLLDLSAP
jgi:hypothetical protein